MPLESAHQQLLDEATKAVYDRSFYAAYPEHPKAYPENMTEDARNWFEGQKNKVFTELQQTEPADWKGAEVSPYTQKPLGIKYPAFSPEKLVENAKNVLNTWRRTSPEDRTSVLLTSLDGIKKRFFDIAFATMHTSGQSFMMSFQASGPHANDRALEALSLGVEELKRFPDQAFWEKPMGKMSVKIQKKWKAIGKGVALVVGCSTFPVWNTVPGLYASLITGNPVIVKPHPGAILPIAIVVAEIQTALKNAGFDPHIVQLAVDTMEHQITKELAEDPSVAIIDYTGGPAFGNYLESLNGKEVFTEKAGVNSVILDSCIDLDAVVQNLAFSASLYSGQMCTAPQNFFIPEDGIMVGDVEVDYKTVVAKLADAINNIASNPKMGPGTLGAIQSAATLSRISHASSMGGNVILEGLPIVNEEFPEARVFRPTVIELNADNEKIYSEECFGPVIFIIKTKDTHQSVEIAKELARKKGALSCGAYTTVAEVKEHIEEQMEEVFTPVSFNLIGPIWMNQNAAFSDFHVTGGNPAGNATFTDAAYIVRRFVWVGHREFVA